MSADVFFSPLALPLYFFAGSLVAFCAAFTLDVSSTLAHRANISRHERNPIVRRFGPRGFFANIFIFAGAAYLFWLVVPENPYFPSAAFLVGAGLHAYGFINNTFFYRPA